VTINETQHAEQANQAKGPTIAQPTLDSIQRTLELQADQIRELARVLHQHDMIRQRDLAQ